MDTLPRVGLWVVLSKWENLSKLTEIADIDSLFQNINLNDTSSDQSIKAVQIMIVYKLSLMYPEDKKIIGWLESLADRIS